MSALNQLHPQHSAPPAPFTPATPDPTAPPHQHSNPTLLTMPVIQQSPPYWVDHTAINASQAPTQQIHYIAVAQPTPPASAAASPPVTEPTAPRPRKPYTTTKVREMWTTAEHDRMLEGLRLFKRDWAKVTRFVGTRSAAQVRSHAQKYFDRVARDKTDDYVPRARPKRKSATPYPRKAREHPSSARNNPQQPQQLPHPSQLAIPTTNVHHPINIPVQSIQHQPQTLSHPHHIHHPSVPLHLASQASLVQQVAANSPCLSQPSQPNIAVQQAVPQPIYSPYLLYRSPTPGQDPRQLRASPVPQASPVSFMGSPYAGHSPAPQIQATAGHQPVYNMFSPLTPAAFPSPMTQSPSMSHAQVSMVPGPHVQTRAVPQQHFPAHSHPGGPMENCAKCAALQRYGNVLQEIGEIRQPSKMTHGQAHGIPPFSSLRVASGMPISEAGSGTLDGKSPLATDAAKKANRALPTSRGASASSSERGRSTSVSLPAAECHDQNEAAARGAARYRARRAKVMKERKTKTKFSGNRASSPSPGQSEESNESVNSSRVKREDERPTKKNDKNSDLKRSRKRKIDNVSVKGRNTNGSGESRQSKRPKRPQQSTRSGKLTSSEDLSSKLPETCGKSENKSGPSSPSPQSGCGSNEGMDSRRNSPGVEIYSTSEQKEIFDAVKSLQILAKTSSSSSPEPKSAPSGAESTV